MPIFSHHRTHFDNQKPTMDASTKVNPYSAPAVAEVATPNLACYYRDGDFLMIRDGADLPMRCIHTNQEVGEGGWRKRKQVAWTPQWIFIFIFFGVLPLLLLSILLQKKAKLTYSLSQDARDRLLKKRFTALGVMLVGIGIAFAGGTVIHGDFTALAIFVGVVVALGGLIGSLMFNPVTVKKHKDGWFTLKGCSPEFLNSL